MRPVIKHAAHLSRRGCSDASETFANFAYTRLSNAGVLPDDLTIEDFSPCDHLQMLQHVLFVTDELDASVTYETLVIVPEALKTELYDQFGNQLEINGPYVRFHVAIADNGIFTYFSGISNMILLFYYHSYWISLDICLFVGSLRFSMMCFLSRQAEGS